MIVSERVISVPVAALSAGRQHRLSDVKADDLDRLVVAYQTDAEAVPPLRVYDRGANAYDVVGGHLRQAAAKKAGLSHVRSIVLPRPDTNDGELWDSFEDNCAHGRPPTVEERREMARVLRRINPRISAKEISKRIGLGVHNVENAIRPRQHSQMERTPSVVSLYKKFIAAWEALESTNFDAIDELSEPLSDAFWDAVTRVGTIAPPPDDD